MSRIAHLPPSLGFVLYTWRTNGWKKTTLYILPHRWFSDIQRPKETSVQLFPSRNYNILQTTWKRQLFALNWRCNGSACSEIVCPLAITNQIAPFLLPWIHWMLMFRDCQAAQRATLPPPGMFMNSLQKRRWTSAVDWSWSLRLKRTSVCRNVLYL